MAAIWIDQFGNMLELQKMNRKQLKYTIKVCSNKQRVALTEEEASEYSRWIGVLKNELKSRSQHL